MKTRIVYPKLWLDDKFADCAQSTKLLFCYLINNNYLSLSPYLHITDRQIMFDTGIKANQLETGKKELTKLKWCLFTENWVFHNHKCAYIDYSGRDRVIASKEEEINNVPQEVKDLFKRLITGYKPNINYKLETINKKLEINKEKIQKKDKSIKSLDDEFCAKVARNYNVPLATVLKKKNDLILYCRSTGKKYKDYQATLQSWIRKDLK